MGKYTEQFKLTAIAAYLDGSKGFRRVAAGYRVDVSLLRRWVASHQANSSVAERPLGRRYSADFKLQVLQYMNQHRLSLRQTAAHFGLGQSSQIGIWQRCYYSGGLNRSTDTCQPKPALMTKRIKPLKPTDTDDTQKSREQLMSELQYMRMENAVLKELKAMREEKERRQTKKS